MKQKNIFVISPYHYCHSVATLIEGLNKSDVVKVLSNTNHNYCKYPVYSLQAQTQVAKMADYVLLAHSALEEKYKSKIKPLLDEIREEVDIFLDGSDYFHYEDNPDKYKFYLKRELDSTKLNGQFKNVEPFIFGAEDRYFTKSLNASHYNLWQGKTDDLVCIMSSCEKRPWRDDIMKSLKDAFDHSDKVFIGECRDGNPLTTVDTGDRHYSGYFNKLLHANISVDSYGCAQARQTGRFWESLANGCLVFYQPIEPYIWPHPFIDGEDFIVFNDTEELVDKAKYYISHPEEARKIAAKGFTKLLKYHTTDQRSSQFIKLCEQYL
jgi:hypothetical protein